MSLPPRALRLIAITPDDPALTEDDLVKRVRGAARGGADAIMFREKRLDDPTFVRRARLCRDAAHAAGAIFILNERARFAAEIAPDALHLTHRSPAPLEARTLFAGPLGVSTHDVADIVAAAKLPLAYVLYGPVFATPSKAGRFSPRGLDGLRAAVAASRVPVVAVGGMEAASLASVRQAGAAGAAVIRALLGRADAELQARRMKEAWAST